jgi:hypothetical protein
MFVAGIIYPNSQKRTPSETDINYNKDYTSRTNSLHFLVMQAILHSSLPHTLQVTPPYTRGAHKPGIIFKMKGIQAKAASKQETVRP